MPAMVVGQTAAPLERNRGSLRRLRHAIGGGLRKVTYSRVTAGRACLLVQPGVKQGVELLSGHAFGHAMKSGVVAVPPPYLSAHSRRIAKNASSPTVVRRTCRVIAPRTWTEVANRWSAPGSPGGGFHRASYVEPFTLAQLQTRTDGQFLAVPCVAGPAPVDPDLGDVEAAQVQVEAREVLGRGRADARASPEHMGIGRVAQAEVVVAHVVPAVARQREVPVADPRRTRYEGPAVARKAWRRPGPPPARVSL